jgi:hypothetical protein
VQGNERMARTSAFRTEESTPDALNERIRWRTEASLSTAVAGGANAIEARLRELDAEWDTERVLETLAASFVLAGTVLGARVDRRWLALPAVVSAFLLQHGLQGWCPPLPIIRALGVRTPAEIAAERTALKAARGDFRPFDRRMGTARRSIG